MSSSFVVGGVVNSTSNLLFAAPPAHGVGLTLGFVGGFGVWSFLGGWGISLDEWWFCDLWGVVFHVDLLVSDIHLLLELVDFLTNS